MVIVSLTALFSGAINTEILSYFRPENIQSLSKKTEKIAVSVVWVPFPFISLEDY